MRKYIKIFSQQANLEISNLSIIDQKTCQYFGLYGWKDIRNNKLNIKDQKRQLTYRSSDIFKCACHFNYICAVATPTSMHLL